MDEADYPGVRISMNCFYDNIRIPMKLDISTGDVITPKEIAFKYQLMFEKREIALLAYNIETVLAEKIETIIARNITNTRMRDFYDIHVLLKSYTDQINYKILKLAFNATSTKRGTKKLMINAESVFDELANDADMIKLWKRYQDNNNYANELLWADVVNSVKSLYLKIQ